MARSRGRVNLGIGLKLTCRLKKVRSRSTVRRRRLSWRWAIFAAPNKAKKVRLEPLTVPTTSSRDSLASFLKWSYLSMVEALQTLWFRHCASKPRPLRSLVSSSFSHLQVWVTTRAVCLSFNSITVCDSTPVIICWKVVRVWPPLHLMLRHAVVILPWQDLWKPPKTLWTSIISSADSSLIIIFD